MEHITLLAPYYCQPEMMKKNIKEWWRYPKEVRDRLTILIIDDGSPRQPIENVLDSVVLPDLDIRVYKIRENIPWNTPGVWNLGFTEAPDGWVLINGIDHIVPAEWVVSILKKKLDKRKYYRFSRKRVHEDGSIRPDKNPYGIILIQKELYWAAGGYDEDFSGCYGLTTGLFMNSVSRLSKGHEDILDVPLVTYGRSVIPDASITEWGRKRSNRCVTKNQALLDKVVKIRKTGVYKPENHLRFDWKRVI